MNKEIVKLCFILAGVLAAVLGFCFSIGVVAGMGFALGSML